MTHARHLSPREELILAAFERGRAASHSNQPRSTNPHRPMSDPDLWEGWNAGYAYEEGPAYSAGPR